MVKVVVALTGLMLALALGVLLVYSRGSRGDDPTLVVPPKVLSPGGPGANPPPVVSPLGENEEGFVAVLIAAESVDVTPKVEGKIAAVTVRVGDHVEKGTVIASMDPQALKDELS